MATKPNSNYILSRQITSLKEKPLVGLIVRVFDQDPKTPDNFLAMKPLQLLRDVTQSILRKRISKSVVWKATGRLSLSEFHDG